MKKIPKQHLGQSWKTTVGGYALAIMLAVQPLLNVEVDFTKRHDVVKYVTRLLFAAGVAFFGKYAADSAQVKKMQNTNKDGYN